jgi:DNA-binding response OmpR family regulator
MSPPAERALGLSAPSRKSALIVFSDPWFEDFLKTFFGDTVDVQIRRSCAEAIQFLAANTPDIIVCESDLPDTPGTTLMQFMHANTGARKTPFIIAFPEGVDFFEVSEAIAAGASSIVTNKSDVMNLAQQMQDLLTTGTKSVLIIDDDEPVRELLRNTFESAEFRVETAVDGMDALGRLGPKLPDLIVLDRLMPRMNGEATLRELQASLNTGAVPVIVLTAMDNAGEASKWLMLGASEFIAKPFDPEEVLERARKLLKMQKGR